MLASMTGFGRALLDVSYGRFVAEIQSVNRKYLEVSVFMPKEFGRFELDVRKWVGELASRGQITVRLHLLPNAAGVKNLLPEAEVLKTLKTGWEKISHELGYPTDKIDLSFLMLHSPIPQKVELARDQDLGDIERCVKEALYHLIQMKLKEGKALCEELNKRVMILEAFLKIVEEIAPHAAQKFKARLLEKMAEVIASSPDLEERILREAMLFAERIDVTEEITRLKSHFVQFKETLNPKGVGVGRKLEFIVQEMGREINTIGSKSADSKVSHIIVEMKSELEKIREQIQNIE